MALTETYFVRKNKKTGHYAVDIEKGIARFLTFAAAKKDRLKFPMNGKYDTIVQVEILEYECLE